MPAEKKLFRAGGVEALGVENPLEAKGGEISTDNKERGGIRESEKTVIFI